VPEFYEPVPDFVRQAFDKSDNEKIKAQNWAIDQHQLKAKNVSRCISDGMNVVIDRSPIDVAAYSHYLGLSVYLDSIGRLMYIT